MEFFRVIGVVGNLGNLREFLFFLGEFGGFEFLGVEFFLGVGFLGFLFLKWF